MLFAAALSGADRFDTAVEEVADDIATINDGAAPDLVVAFIGAVHQQHYVRMHRSLRERFPGATLLGCSAGGTLGATGELEEGAGLAVCAATLPGVELHPFHLEADEVPEPTATPQTWRDRLHIPGDTDPSFLLLPDPFSSPVPRLLQGLDHAFPQSTKIGGLVSGAKEAGEGVLFSGDELNGSGTAGLALAGNLQLDSVVAQGCRPIGVPMFITRGSGNVINELDGRRPAVVLQDLYDQLGADDQARVRHSLFVGLVMQDRQEVYGQGDFLIRNIIGLDGDTGALAIASEARPNTVLQFHLRDAQTSAEDLRSMLVRHREQHDSPARGALMFSCLGRGQGLYDQPNHDIGVVQDVLDAVPTAGFFCNGELGPVHQTTHLHGYTSVLGLFRPRS